MDVKLPTDTKLGKIQDHWDRGYIGIYCTLIYEDCEYSIALRPNDPWVDRSRLDSISDKEAVDIFIKKGWLVKNYNNSSFNACPSCRDRYNKNVG